MGRVAALLAFVSALALALVSCGPSPTRAVSIDPKLDCALREFTWAYAQRLLPARGSLPDVYDALELGTMCGTPPPAEADRKPRPLFNQMRPDRPRPSSAAFTVWVDPVRCPLSLSVCQPACCLPACLIDCGSVAKGSTTALCPLWQR
jgi:hypothetical protein